MGSIPPNTARYMEGWRIFGPNIWGTLRIIGDTIYFQSDETSIELPIKKIKNVIPDSKMIQFKTGIIKYAAFVINDENFFNSLLKEINKYR